MYKKDDPSPLPSDILPRYDLREKQCRRYEQIIATAATQGSVEVDPAIWTQSPRGMQARTLALRIQDAILGFKTYHYPSTAIPAGFDFKSLRAFETADGKVRLVNRAMATVARAIVTMSPHASNLAAIETLCAAHREEDGLKEIRFSTPDEGLAVKKLIADRFPHISVIDTETPGLLRIL